MVVEIRELFFFLMVLVYAKFSPGSLTCSLWILKAKLRAKVKVRVREKKGTTLAQ